MFKAHFKKEKWQLIQETEVKNLFNTVRLAIKRNEQKIKRKNPETDLYLENFEEEEKQNEDKEKESTRPVPLKLPIIKERENAFLVPDSTYNKVNSINQNIFCQDMVKKKRF